MATNQIDNPNQTGGQRYRHLFKHAPVCIFVVDLTASQAPILEANQRAELVYGYTAVELVGMSAGDLMSEDVLIEALRIVQRVQQGQIVTTETAHRRRDGTHFPVRVTAAADPTDDGQMIVTVEDITAEKQRRSEAEAIASERLRIAQEIHDGVAQNLAGIRFKSALWHHLADAAPPGMRAALDELQNVLVGAIADIRRAIFALRPVDLDELGFFPALIQWVEDFGEQNQLALRLEVSGQQEALPTDYELPLFRIIQEGLNNVYRHAQASSALVNLAVDEAGGVAVLVGDNGCGFDPGQLGAADQPGHFGLRQMRERVLARGGTLDICSAIGQGTELVITLPPLANEVDHAAD